MQEYLLFYGRSFVDIYSTRCDENENWKKVNNEGLRGFYLTLNVIQAIKSIILCEKTIHLEWKMEEVFLKFKKVNLWTLGRLCIVKTANIKDGHK